MSIKKYTLKIVTSHAENSIIIDIFYILKNHLSVISHLYVRNFQMTDDVSCSYVNNKKKCFSSKKRVQNFPSKVEVLSQNKSIYPTRAIELNIHSNWLMEVPNSSKKVSPKYFAWWKIIILRLTSEKKGKYYQFDFSLFFFLYTAPTISLNFLIRRLIFISKSFNNSNAIHRPITSSILKEESMNYIHKQTCVF